MSNEGRAKGAASWTRRAADGHVLYTIHEEPVISRHQHWQGGNDSGNAGVREVRPLPGNGNVHVCTIDNQARVVDVSSGPSNNG